jgi:hypothetical protein
MVRDPEIIRIFNKGINFHSNMAATSTAFAYEEFQSKYKAEGEHGSSTSSGGRWVN